MTTPLITDEGGHWALGLKGARVDRCCIDRQVRLEMDAYAEPDDKWVLTITSPFTLIGPNDETVPISLDNRLGLTEVVLLLDMPVIRAVVSASGAILLSCGEAISLRVPARDEFEAWRITGPRGLEVVSQAGGKLSFVGPEGEGIVKGERADIPADGQPQQPTMRIDTDWDDPYILR